MGPGQPNYQMWGSSAPALKKPQKLWTIVDQGGSYHTLEIRPKTWHWEEGPRLFLDGQRAGNFQAPKPGMPRTERELLLSGNQIIVALGWHRDWDECLRVDLFVNGLSMLDGRAIEQARSTPMEALDRYDATMAGAQASWKRMAGAVPAIGFLAALSGTTRGNDPFVGIAIAVVVAAVMTGMAVGIYFTNAWNLRRPGLGSLRWLTLIATAVAYPTLVVAGTLLLYGLLPH